MMEFWGHFTRHFFFRNYNIAYKKKVVATKRLRRVDPCATSCNRVREQVGIRQNHSQESGRGQA